VETNPELAAVLAQVSVDHGLRHAFVAGRELNADSGRQLRQRLASALYETFHAGHVFGEAPSQPTRDPECEESLRSATPHSTTPAAAVESGTAGVVLVDGVRVRLPEGPGPEGMVRIPAHRPGLSPGYFLVDGSRGRGSGRPTLRIYAHVGGREEAIRTWGEVVRVLEEAAVPYRMKVSSSPELFPRRDGLVVYLGPSAWHAVPLVVSAVPAPETAERQSLTSSFARTVAPGVALAWEPEDDRPGYRGMSFGQHRTTVIADFLMAYACEQNTERSVHEYVEEQMPTANIAPDACYRNINSPRLTVLDQVAH
jgi:hypothetical protein